jgi:hypothetical protein
MAVFVSGSVTLVICDVRIDYRGDFVADVVVQAVGGIFI